MNPFGRMMVVSYRLNQLCNWLHQYAEEEMERIREIDHQSQENRKIRR